MLLALSILFFLAGLLAAWLLILRPIYRSPDFRSAYERHQNFVAAICRFRTMAAAKLLGLGSLLVTGYDFVAPLAAGQDWSPITGNLPSWAWPMILFGVSGLFAYLRKTTVAPAAEAAPIMGGEPDVTQISETEAVERENDPMVPNVPQGITQ